MAEILGSLVEEYDADINEVITKTISETEIKTKQTQPEIQVVTANINTDYTRISAECIEKIRDNYGTIKLSDEDQIICNGREGQITVDDETVKYVINKNVVDEINDKKFVFDFIILYTDKYQTFSDAPKYVKVLPSQFFYGRTDDEKIQKAIQLIKASENYIFDE
ncbi:MAG: hypothetical protein K0B07_02070 [DPANN group archaeon]|nr:hypothetical protein [DPANN group archaeon]